MINSYLKKRGAATLIITVMLLVTITLIILFAANNIIFQQRISSNTNRANQAYEAAEAGLEYAIPYFQANRTILLANNSGGYLLPYTNASTTNVTLANNSKFSFVYTNPIANDYSIIEITSTGVSDDSSATRIVRQQIRISSILVSIPSVPLTTKGSLNFSGSSDIYNSINPNTILAGSTVNISGSAVTHPSSGPGSSSGSINSDVQQNVSSLANMTTDEMTASYFGLPINSLKASFANYYTSAGNTSYSGTLNGKTGTSIWIDQTSGDARLSGTTVIGSSSAPVILVVNGNFDMSGNVTIYGFVYVIGGATTDVLGNVSIIGGMSATNNLSFSGSTQVTYSPTVLNNLKTQAGTSFIGKIAGSWRDF